VIDVLAARVPAVKPARGVPGPGSPLDGAAAGRRRPLSTPPTPRRVSGPARRKSAGTRSRRRAAGRRGTALGRGSALRSGFSLPAELLLGWLRLVRLRWAERLSRRRLAAALRAAVLGRTWIALVAFALIGIVTLQLGLLKLNASIGRGLEHEALLQRQNAQLSIENSETDASASIQSRAERLGMELVPPSLLRFLSAQPGSDTKGATAALSAPIGSSAGGSPEAPVSASQGQTGASPAGTGSSSAGTGASSAGTGASSAGTEPASTQAASSPSAGSQGTPASEPGASGTASSPPTTASAPEAPGATPGGPAASPPPAGGSPPGAPAAGGSGEGSSGGGTQSAGPGG
jgi:hypothetical protein